MAAERDFQDFLTDLDAGQFHQDLSRALPKLVKDCLAGNAGGQMTITLKVKPRNGAQVDIIASYTTKAPPLRKPDPTILFVDPEDGQLSLYAPVSSHAKQVPLRKVPMTPPSRLKVVGKKNDEPANDHSDDKTEDNKSS